MGNMLTLDTLLEKNALIIAPDSMMVAAQNLADIQNSVAFNLQRFVGRNICLMLMAALQILLP